MELLDAALGYAARGISVFPVHAPRQGRCDCGKTTCTSPAKHPRTPNGLDDASTDTDTIQVWWQKWPNANIGLVTGEHFDVLDVDGGAGKDGWSDLARVVADHGCLPAGPVALTGSGGAHYLFNPTGIGLRTRIVSSGARTHLDWRGKGGYIVAPPSTHICGKRYEWAVGLDDEPIRDAPPWLVDLLKPPATIPRSPTGAPADIGAYGTAALERELGRLVVAPVGQRNDALNRAAHSLGQLVAGGVLTAADVVDHLLTAASRMGLTEHEAEPTIISGLRSGMRQPRRASR